MTPTQFTSLVHKEGKVLYRDMPWRQSQGGIFDPYKILVSEVMLQQTQVQRVVPFFNAFMQKFPDVTALAQASLSEVLVAWNGLGYNRRAGYLHRAAQSLAHIKHWTYQDLVACKGIGPNTAKAVLVYSYNQPELFIETNIRTVYIHYFFSKHNSVTDDQILKKLTATIDTTNPREWYWALMDIGTNIKKQNGNVAQKSKLYKKQATFAGSKRQIRGAVIRYLTKGEGTYEQLYEAINDDRLQDVLKALVSDALIYVHNNVYYLGAKP